MSFILEALRKSERERRQGQVPGLDAPPVVIDSVGGGRAARGRLLAGLVLVALLASGVAALWLSLSPTPEPAAGAPAAAAQRAAPRPAEADGSLDRAQLGRLRDRVDGAVAGAPARDAPAGPAGASATAGGPPSAAAAAQPAADPGRLQRMAAATGPEVRASDPPAGAARPGRARADAAGMAAAGDGRDGDRARAEPLPRPANPTPAPEPEAPPARPPGRVLDYHELPSALQRSMPKLVVTGHSISEEDNVRLVVINDRVLREGEQVAPDLRLEAIGADGVVLNYRGYRFRPAP